MTEYWFGFHDDEPRVIFRLIRSADKRADEYYDWARREWLPHDRIFWWILNGEIGYEKASQEEVEAFMRKKNVRP